MTASSLQVVTRLSPTMADGLQCMRRALAAQGLRLHEPAGQDGRRCQILAFIDQAETSGCWPFGFIDVDSAEAGMIGWLQAHANDVTVTAVEGDAGRLSRLSDAWIPKEISDIVSRCPRAWGDHITLVALLGWTHETYNILAAADVTRMCGRIDEVTVPGIEIGPAVHRFRLAYTGNHYLSIVPLARCAVCPV